MDDDTIEGHDVVETPEPVELPADSEPVETAPISDVPTDEAPVVEGDAPAHEGFVERVEDAIAGWPKTFFHPVHGKREFATPNDHAREVGGNTDWRFTSAADADRARTDAEAQLVILNNHQDLLEAHKANAPVVRNSVQAEEARDAGKNEPGLN